MDNPHSETRPMPLQTRAAWLAHTLFLTVGFAHPAIAADRLELAGVTITPHVQAAAMRYRQPPEPSLGARVQLFLRNAGDTVLTLAATSSVRLRERTPDEWLQSGDWTWHDSPAAWPEDPLSLPPGAMTVWTFNGHGREWGVGTDSDLRVGLPDGGEAVARVDLLEPIRWISAVSFVGDVGSPFPTSVVVHVANGSDRPWRLDQCQLWLPATNASWRALQPQPPLTPSEPLPADGVIPPHDRGVLRAATGRLPLTYAAVAVQGRDEAGTATTLWAHLRVRRETFDISGGWVQSELPAGGHALQFEPYLKTLTRLHLNTAHIGHTPGYTDSAGPDGLYTRFPLKYFNRLQPLAEYDRDEVLPRIHAVEFLGEPQYGGGRPVPPMDVWRALAPYQRTRLPTTVTHSEERTWRYYAGLSDYPHYDAYRVCAPAADSWRLYDRWGDTRIRWAAPLETIGDMTRSLRDLNRPASIACWSQGAHHGWDPEGGRERTSPTPDELRVQAYHALAARVTSLYWFNLSLRSLVRWRDLIEPITRVDREIRLMEGFLLEGDAVSYRRVLRADGQPDWDLSVVAAPQGALLFAVDLDYAPDPAAKVFRFGSPRPVRLHFPLPSYLRGPAEVLRLTADGVTAAAFSVASDGVIITDTLAVATVYVAAARAGLGAELETRRQLLAAAETAIAFDPAGSETDFAVLAAALAARR